jgi:hypothetical protein
LTIQEVIVPLLDLLKDELGGGAAGDRHAERARHGPQAPALAPEGRRRPRRAAPPPDADDAPDPVPRPDFETTQRYIRMAEALREGLGVPFPELPSDLVSHAAIARGFVTYRNDSVNLRGGRDSNPRPPA